MPDLTLESCAYRYRWRRALALRPTSLHLSPGRTVLLGPNGAGKSTLLGLAASALVPTAGSVTVDGVGSGERAYRRLVSWLPQAVAPVPGNTVREQVALHGWLKGQGRAEAWEAAGRAVDRVGLADLSSRRATALSGGQRARMGIAQALVHDAAVILLDEPTAALDPVQRALFVDLLADLDPGICVVVSTHDVHELDSVYDRVVVMDSGSVRFDGDMAAFLRPEADGAALAPVAAYAHRIGVSA